MRKFGSQVRSPHEFKNYKVPWPSWLRRGANNAKISSSISLGTIFFFLHLLDATQSQDILEYSSLTRNPLLFFFMDSVLVIHIGAGRHSKNHSQKYKKLLKSALRTGNLVQASRIIERSSLTNTGYGSSVDRTGEATSDASLIEVASRRILNSLSILNIYNDVYPTEFVEVALRQLETEFRIGSVNRQFGLSKPVSLDYRCYLAYLNGNSDAKAPNGNGVFAGRQPTNLVSKRGRASYDTFKVMFDTERDRADQSNNPLVCSSEPTDMGQPVNMTTPQLLKQTYLSERAASYRRKTKENAKGVTKGNITPQKDYIPRRPKTPRNTNKSSMLIQAYSLNSACHKDIEISCMCSGNGDDIITMNLASYLSESIADTLADLKEWPQLGPLLVSRILRKSNQVVKTAVNGNLEEITYVGVIMVIISPTTSRLVFCHSTETFYFAFRSQGKFETVLSRADCPIGEFLHGEYKL
ncbi:hypothetical protein JCM33374_g6218 [Metschnikowia sp. JCM 33374]|nr:hypothetical protein JCM33374_g6218 [Metschnikowia sp. JCM 33374]